MFGLVPLTWLAWCALLPHWDSWKLKLLAVGLFVLFIAHREELLPQVCAADQRSG